MSKYKVNGEDLYIYQRITRYFIDGTLSIDSTIESPYKNIEIRVKQNSVRGYARRNYQREQLELRRGRILTMRYGDNEFLFGKYDTIKKKMTIYVNSSMQDEHVAIIKKIIAHLMHHEIDLEVSTIEKNRLRTEVMWKKGDRVQRQGGRDGRTGSEPVSDYWD